jgi:hypothetical protein
MDTLELARTIADMATLAATKDTFTTTYYFPNGTALVVSKNGLTGRGLASLATLPIDASGVEQYERAEEWQTVYDVAERIAVLAVVIAD